MITFHRAALCEPAVEGHPLTVQDAGGIRTVEATVPLGDLRAGDAVVLAEASVEVGIETFDLTIALGRWPAGAPDPAGPLGLASTPVIVLPDPVWSDLATAGALRAGQVPACLRLPGDGPALGLSMLVAVAEGADVVLIEGGSGLHLRIARVLGGRPLAVLPVPDRAAVERMFQGCGLDVHVPIPSLGDPARSRLHGFLGPLELEATHHLVEVDPAPAFAHAHLDIAQASIESLMAAAAGVLAGRLAAGNRRWRAQLES